MENQWVYVERKAIVPQEIDQINLRIETHGGNAGAAWFDDLKIERKGAAKTVIVQENNYYPFGLQHKGYNNVVSANANSVAEKYKFGGKEHQDELNLGWYDVSARNYDPALGRWMNIDPLAEQMRRHSPYNYAFNNPIYFIDPDGRKPKKPIEGDNLTPDDDNGLVPDDWVETTGESGNTSIVWDENVTSANDKDLQASDRYLGKAVVVFEGSENEKLGKGNNLFGEGANLAKATVYGPDGADDIKEYGAYTMSSDPSKYGTVADGEYNVYYDKVGKSGALKSNWAVEGRGNVPARNGVNPAFPNRNPGYLNGVFIHRSNNNGYAGSGVSKGCPLICPSYNNPNNGWNEFNQQLQGVSQFKMILTRDKK